MRYEAAIRLGVYYESLKAVNPEIVYCHTRGFERGERELLPGNDQVAGALAGTLHEVGGTGDGGRPYWSLTSLGDTGNGFLSAIAVMQALYHRRRTGKGQKVGTSIIYAHLLNASNVYLHADGSPSDRARLDSDQLGVSPRYRLYETADGWLCVAAVEDGQWKALTELVGATEGEAIEAAMRTKPATEWFDQFDAAGVPCEVASGDFPMQMFEDPELVAKRWVASHPHPDLGRLDTYGVSVDFSETPTAIVSGPLLLGEYTREIMSELGYTDDRIQELLDAGVAASR
jgi:crotonobetainyl-CoA:carnitine CoA-transferase CaiB-like acyl-CoA transferase